MRRAGWRASEAGRGESWRWWWWWASCRRRRRSCSGTNGSSSVEVSVRRTTRVAVAIAAVERIF